MSRKRRQRQQDSPRAPQTQRSMWLRLGVEGVLVFVVATVLLLTHVVDASTWSHVALAYLGGSSLGDVARRMFFSGARDDQRA